MNQYTLQEEKFTSLNIAPLLNSNSALAIPNSFFYRYQIISKLGTREAACKYFILLRLQNHDKAPLYLAVMFCGMWDRGGRIHHFCDSWFTRIQKMTVMIQFSSIQNRGIESESIWESESICTGLSESLYICITCWINKINSNRGLYRVSNERSDFPRCWPWASVFSLIWVYLYTTSWNLRADNF